MNELGQLYVRWLAQPGMRSFPLAIPNLSRLRLSQFSYLLFLRFLLQEYYRQEIRKL
jgi:hypothetical protein